MKIRNLHVNYRKFAEARAEPALANEHFYAGGRAKKSVTFLRRFRRNKSATKVQQPKPQKLTPWRPGLETYFSRDYRPKGGGVKILARTALLHRHARRAVGQRSVRWLGLSLESVGVGWFVWCHFLQKNACTCMEKGHFFSGSRRSGAREKLSLWWGRARKRPIF